MSTMIAPSASADDVTRGVSLCLDYIREMHGGVSLVELKNLLVQAGFECRGQIAVTMPADHNVVWWAGMSQVFADVMIKLLDTQAVELQPTAVLTYMIDGEVLKFPVVTRFRKGGHKKIHWFPVTYNLRESEQPARLQAKRARV